MMCDAGICGLARSRITWRTLSVAFAPPASWSCQVNKLAASVTDAARPDV
jgi:hypothetical protein